MAMGTPSTTWCQISWKRKKIIPMIGDIKSSHIFKEQNKVTGAMAKMTLNHERGVRVFDHPLALIQSLLIEDMMGVRVNRRLIQENH